ncbi:formate--tetrahydrofolate ligase, partial [Vibrio cholerae]|uniref:formate--tetrahydrofolate ligase n=1 Tax=Vibrio cholerae TaxID=666 RepID=UPI003C7CF191
MLPDIEICRATPLASIDTIAQKAGLLANEYESHGLHKAKVSLHCLERLANPCAKPIVVTVLPSPSGVGVIAVTRMNLPLGLLANRSRQCSDTLAL